MKHALSRKLAVTAASAITVALCGAGLASASTSARTPAASGTEHFYLMTTVINDLGIGPRNAKGARNFNANPVVNEETITATGQVKL